MRRRHPADPYTPTHRCTHASAYRNANLYTYRNAYSRCRTYCYTHTLAYSNADAYRHTNTDSDTGPRSAARRNANIRGFRD